MYAYFYLLINTYCFCFRDAELKEAFNFAKNLDFLNNCFKETNGIDFLFSYSVLNSYII